MFYRIEDRIRQSLRLRLKREMVTIVKNVFFADSYSLDGFEHYHFERNSFIRIIGDVKLGESFAVGQFSRILVDKNAVLVAGNHAWIADNCHIEPGTGCKIVIRQRTSLQSRCQIRGDVWLGINSVILPGVTVGDGSVVGANAVVSKDVEPYTVVGGVPGKFIKSRF